MDEVATEIAKLREQIEKLSSRLEAKLSEGDNPISLKCEAVLETPVRCYDFAQTRRFAACEAWRLMDTKHIGWREAITEAWDKVRKSCTWS